MNFRRSLPEIRCLSPVCPRRDTPHSTGMPERSHPPDVMFTVASNTPVKLGIGKESVTARPRAQFPYVPLVS